MKQNLIWRPLVHLDIPAATELLAAAERVDHTSEHYDMADLAEEFDDESLDLGSDSVAVLDGTTLIGIGLVRGQTLVRDLHAISLWGAVHPQHRGRGVGRGILAQQLHRGAHLHLERHPHVPARLEVRPYDHCTSHVRLAKAAGLIPIRHWYEMERQLAEPLPPIPDVPAGLRIVPYDPDRDDEVRHAHNTAFAAAFASTEQDAETWRQWFTGSRAFRPELSNLVLADEQVVAFLLSYFYRADAMADGSEEGWIGQVGTLAAYRRRGIGAALIGRALAGFREAGFSRAVVDADSKSDIGGLALYSRLGFRVARKRTSFVKELRAAP